MIERSFPKEEQRMYLTEKKYLLLLQRKGRAKDNDMSSDEFSRNIWLMEDDKELWRIQIRDNNQEYPFNVLSYTKTEYTAFRLKDWRGFQEIYLLDMKTGMAELYPATHNPHAGEKKQLYVKWENRVCMSDGSYIVRTRIPGTEQSRNITRVSSTGHEMWRISVNSDTSTDPHYYFSNLYFYKDGTLVASVNERVQFALDMETGKATPRYFAP